MRDRHIAMLIVPAAAVALCAAVPAPALARHAPHERIQFNSTTHHRARHVRQMDTNDVAGHG
ncbi:MAG TPA: hypothetical protein VGG68_00350, partial [Caulobacteraceae bacterium]